MKKKRLYLILALITAIILFTASALCDRCTASGTEDAADGGQESGPEEEINGETVTEDAAGEETMEENAETQEESNGTEDGESVQQEEETEEEDQETQMAWEEPTIELKIYEGPLYSSADDVCYWRVKAIVTGVPAPAIQFNRDDSNGSWGQDKAQVNLADPADSFNLQATASNSQGTATDSIMLEWGCNQPPEISDIIMMGDHFTGVTYSVSVSASDPDGDAMKFFWSVNGGSLSSTTGDNVDWTMPVTAGNYQITAEAEDGNGGTDARTESVVVTDLLGPPIAAMDLPIISNEGGWISQDGNFGYGSHLVGDTSTNSPAKGFISFDITSLAGATVETARLTVERNTVSGDASGFLPLWIGAVSWEPGHIEPGDYGLPVSPIESYSAANFMTSAPKLKLYLQAAIDSGKDRFQLVMFFSGMATDNDNTTDYWGYSDAKTDLYVEYTP